MALTETNFHLSRIVLNAAVFVSLCVPTIVSEVRRCYWCGPLAEQVHRSQRAPPCSSPYDQVTDCDPGFPYCAVVATSPPYIESRYCVKVYQDECYSLYCNSTRTWRMICPCRGDLCNGPNTEHEDDAFTGLAKLVGRTQKTRVQRALISTSGFINMNTNRKNRIDNTTEEENKNISNVTIDNNLTDGDQVEIKEMQINDTNTTADRDNINFGSEMNNTMARTVADDKNDESQLTETTPTAKIDVIENNEHLINETIIQIDIPTVDAESRNLKTEIILMGSESTKLVNDSTSYDDMTSMSEMEPTHEVVNQTAIELKATIKEREETTPDTTTIKILDKEVKLNDNKVKPSEPLPPAEALQHNDTPTTTKTTKLMTTLTTTMSFQHTDTTTEATVQRNNTAVKIDAHILALAVGIILQF